MSGKPTPKETVTWQRRFAAQANNRAWALADPEEREILDANMRALPSLAA
jgi:hypothetical protein